MRTHTRFFIRSLFLIALSDAQVGPAAAQACPGGVCPVVEVRGNASFGPTILCRGSACGDLLLTMQIEAYLELDSPPLSDDGPPIDRNWFCARLRADKPGNCSGTGSGPDIPGVTTSNLGLPMSAAEYLLTSNVNGCGTGSLLESIANQLGAGVFPTYSSNPDNPIAGSSLSFRSACNNHDMCYVGGESRSVCDMTFGNQMASACNATFAGTNYHQVCMGYRDAYSSAVTLGGEPAYAAAQAVRECGIWHQNMETNQCPK